MYNSFANGFEMPYRGMNEKKKEELQYNHSCQENRLEMPYRGINE
jgi:hypothetical protein